MCRAGRKTLLTHSLKITPNTLTYTEKILYQNLPKKHAQCKFLALKI